MKKATTIFGSKSERRAFEAIDQHLPAGWRLYGNTPLSQIVEIRKGELREKEWDYYLKASVDFVLTNPTHEPALAIEFDGLGEGYSSGKRYILERQLEEDPYRELKTNFKLDVCYAVGLPLVVISFEEIEHITDDDTLSIVNSMVGLHIATQEYWATIQEWDRQGKGVGKTFDEMLWDDSVLRTRLRFQRDPILSRLEGTWEDFEALGANWGMSSVSRPDCMTALREKKPFTSVGCRYEVMGGKLQNPVSVTVWVRNFAGEEMGASLDSEFIPTHGINPLLVAENIAWYVGQKRAIEISRSVAA
jgi:Protein of unknown function (DUF2726)